MVKVSTDGMMGVIIEGIGKKILFMVLESMFGTMVEVMKVTGNGERCMERVPIYGRMEGGMKGSTKTIRSMVRESIIGRMVKNFRGYGSMERGREKGRYITQIK
jgi:hypothetical protein